MPIGCGGLGTAEPAEEAPVKDEHTYSRPSSSDRYALPMTNNNANAQGGYPNYTSRPEPPHQSYQHQSYQQQQYQHQTPYNSNAQNSYSYGNNNFSDTNYGKNSGRPPSSTPSYRSSTQSSTSSWGSQPPLTSSKRDQNWEKKRRLWLARKNSSNGSIYGDRPSSTSSSWSSGPAGGVFDDSINPPSPLSKFMHQQEQQQQPPPPTPGVDYQRMGTASSTRSSFSSSYMNHHPQTYSTPTQMVGTGYPAGGASLSRSGLSTASSTASSTTSSRRQPPGGQCQWSLG
ncbi:hypothetical protein V7S43_009292 [Phytophthora oleae]|uniref:Uncharacterized protein n=1 Tax=Phytophthora oleae TaxID=2107226 RepID=A0ABD3FFZ7_9STRA